MNSSGSSNYRVRAFAIFSLSLFALLTTRIEELRPDFSSRLASPDCRPPDLPAGLPAAGMAGGFTGL